MSQNPFLFGGSGTPIPPNQQSYTNTPSANGAAHTPSQAQQTATQHSMALPGIDLSSVLQGISPEQLAVIAHMMQTGQIPLPPPPPSASQAQTPIAPSPSNATLPTTLLHPTVPDRDGDLDMDREEGEVEEGEVEENPRMRDFLTTPPKGPRNNSRSPRLPLPPAHDDRRGSQQGQRVQTPRSATGSQRQSAMNGAAFDTNARSSSTGSRVHSSSHTQARSDKHAAAKSFVLEMHRAGYSFDDLSKEITQPHALRRLYQELGLIIPTHSSDETVALDTSRAAAPAMPDQRKASLPKAPPPAKSATPQDRSEYLAKLKAAKNKKAESGASAPPLPKPAEKPKPVVDTQNAASSKPATPSPATAKVIQTDLVRQKLEALKAKMARDKASSEGVPSSPMSRPSGTSSGAIPPTKPGLGDGLAEAASRASDEAAKLGNQIAQSSAAQPSPSNVAQSSLPSTPNIQRGVGLPGLFVGGSSLASPSHGHQTAPPQPQRSQSHAPQSHVSGLVSTNSPLSSAVAAQRQAAGASGAPKRPYSTYNQGYADEPFIIVDSDDESDTAADAENGAATRRKGTVPHAHSTSGASKFSAQGFSAKSTPGTPGTPKDELARKLSEIAEAQKRLIVLEEQKRRKAAARSERDSEGQQRLDETAKGSSANLAIEEGEVESQQEEAGPNNLRPSSAGAKSDSSASQADEKARLQTRLHELEDELHGGVPLGSAKEQSKETPTSAAAHVQSTFSEDLGEASGDDVDFYGATPAESDGGDEAVTSKIVPSSGSQATTVFTEGDVTPAATANGKAEADAIDPLVETSNANATVPSENKDQGFDGEGLYDDGDDMDDIYDPLPSNSLPRQVEKVADEDLSATAERDINNGTPPSATPAPAPDTVESLTQDDATVTHEQSTDHNHDSTASEPAPGAGGQAEQGQAAQSADETEDDDSDDAMDTSSDDSSMNMSDDSESEDGSEEGEMQEDDLNAYRQSRLENGPEDGTQVSTPSDDSGDANDNSGETPEDDQMAVDDDLAPELQPAKEEPTVPSEEVRAGSSWPDEYGYG